MKLPGAHKFVHQFVVDDEDASHCASQSIMQSLANGDDEAEEEDEL
mgnify:CR=1 FL=1